MCRVPACHLSAVAYLIIVAAVSVLTLPAASAAYLYPGSTYVLNSIDTSVCAYPQEATPTGGCPFGPPWINDPDFLDEAPPNVNVSATVIEFQGLDQQKFTFSVTVQFLMAWMDNRCWNATDMLDENLVPKNCTKRCAKSSAATDRCCDNIWLPTINLMNAIQTTVVEEDYSLSCGTDMYSTDSNMDGYTYPNLYVVTLSATYSQNFDFTAYPFDQHALGVRVECIDCHMDRFSFNYSNVKSGGWLLSQDGSDTSDAGGFATTSSVGDDSTTAQVTYPESSGWKLVSADLGVINITRDKSHTLQTQANNKSAALGLGPDSYGVVLVIRTQRVTRIFYALQTIIPIIILAASSFLTFLISKDKFVDRMKTLASLLVSTYVLQYTLTTIMPQTYTLLAPHYLIFASMVLMLLLIIIAAVSAILVHRQDHFQWAYDMAAGRRKWQGRVQPLQWGVKHGPNHREQSRPEFQGKLGIPCSGTDSCPCDSCQDKEEGGSKAEHDEAVVKQAHRRYKRWPIGLRHFGVWWSTLAMHGAQGYREHVALIWEVSALAVAAALYAASVIAVLVVMVHHGRYPNTA